MRTLIYNEYFIESQSAIASVVENGSPFDKYIEDSASGDDKRSTKVFSHPLENNLSITDHRIILPIEISMKLIISKDKTSSIYKELQSFFISADEVSVKTKADQYDNMFVSDMSHIESPEKFDSLEVDVVFTEIQTQSGAVGFSPIDQNQQNTIGLGELSIQVA